MLPEAFRNEGQRYDFKCGIVQADIVTTPTLYREAHIGTIQTLHLWNSARARSVWGVTSDEWNVTKAQQADSEIKWKEDNRPCLALEVLRFRFE